MKVKHILYVFVTIVFFTACSPDQAVKKYYKACLKGDYDAASRQVIAVQREACATLGDYLGKAESESMHRRKVKVREVQVKPIDDTSSVASCTLIVQSGAQSDTTHKVVMLKKESGRWLICNGMLFSK